MDIVVKYCGGCNSQIDRPKIIQDMKSLLEAGDHLTSDVSLAPFKAGMLICGCPSACAQKPDLNDLSQQWIVVAGKTINFQALPEDCLAAAAVQKIKKMRNRGSYFVSRDPP